MKTYTFHEHVTTERKLRETKYQSKKVSLQSLFYSLGLILLGAVGLIFFSDQKAFAVLFGVCIALGALFPLLPWLVCEANRRQLRIHGVEPMDYTHELDEEGLHYQFDFLSDQRTLIPYSSIKRVELYENLLFFVPKSGISAIPTSTLRPCPTRSGGASGRHSANACPGPSGKGPEETEEGIRFLGPLGHPPALAVQSVRRCKICRRQQKAPSP